MRADSYGHYRTVEFAPEAGVQWWWAQDKVGVSARKQAAEVFAGAWTWLAAGISCTLEIAGLLRSPRAPCRDICGGFAGVDWGSGSPPLGFPPPPPTLRALFLLWSTALPHTLIMPMLHDVRLSLGIQPFLLPGGVHLQCVSTLLILCSCVWLIIRLVCS